MSRVLRIAENDNVFERAQAAIRETKRLGRLPLKWYAGRRVWNQLRHQRDRTPTYETEQIDTLLGVPIFRHAHAPPDMLELDEF